MYKLIYEDIVNILVILALVLLWRGGWQLNEMYILEDKRIGGPVTHVVGQCHTDIALPYPAHPVPFHSSLPCHERTHPRWFYIMARRLAA